MFKTILWATDGSANADRALPYAKELAEASGAKLVVAHCRELLMGRSSGLPVNADEPELIGKIHDQVVQAAGQNRDRQRGQDRQNHAVEVVGIHAHLSTVAGRGQYSQVYAW